jgi:hypothetical protein
VNSDSPDGSSPVNPRGGEGGGGVAHADRVEVGSFDEALEICYDNGWTDGLPVIPPTEDRVAKLLTGVGRDRYEIIGPVPPRGGVATVETVAINAAMAGCLPPHLPVVLAALEAMLEPRFNLNGVQATTHINVPLLIVGGPIVRDLGFNSKLGVFGGGNRSNAAVGRAIRLVLLNLGGGSPLQLDRATFGHPGKYAYCIAEDLDENPWAPLHSTLASDIAPEDSAVTVFSCEAPHNIVDTDNSTPEGLLWVIAASMTKIGGTNTRTGGECLVVLAPERARRLRASGWSRQDVQQYLFDHASVSVERLRRAKSPRLNSHSPEWDEAHAEVKVYKRPEDIHIMVAGGPGPHAVWCPGWGNLGGFAISKPIDTSSSLRKIPR